MLPGDTGLVPCQTPLLQMQYGRLCPSKPYVVPSFPEYLARLLSDPDAEQLCDQACNETMRRVKNSTTIQDVRTVFEADLLKTFEVRLLAGCLLIEGMIFTTRSCGNWTFSILILP